MTTRPWSRSSRELWAALVIAQTGALGNARIQPPAPATVLHDKTRFRAIRTPAGQQGSSRRRSPREPVGEGRKRHPGRGSLHCPGAKARHSSAGAAARKTAVFTWIMHAGTAV